MTTLKSPASGKAIRARPKRHVVAAASATAPRIAAEASGGVRVQLEPGLEVKDVEAAHQLLLTAWGDGKAITVDVGRVRSVDTAGAQLLLALQGEASRRGVTLAFQGESAPLTHTLAALGLSDKVRLTSGRG